MATDLYFMGGDYNSQFKSKLPNYLQIIYNQPTIYNNWINTDKWIINLYKPKAVIDSKHLMISQCLQQRTLELDLIIRYFSNRILIEEMLIFSLAQRI